MSQTTYLFTLILGRNTEFTDDVAERVELEVGDDTLFGVYCGVPQIDFMREADSFREAMLSAIAAVEKIGLRVISVRVDRADIQAVLEAS